MDMRRKMSILETWAQYYCDRYSATERWPESKSFPRLLPLPSPVVRRKQQQEQQKL